MALLVAPYNNSMRIGQGFNSYTQKICIDNAVVIDPTLAAATDIKPKVTGSSQVCISSDHLDVTDSMNISGSLSIKYGAIGGSGSGAYVDSDKFKDSDLNFFINVKVVNQTINLKDALKFEPIKDLEPGKFTEVFGDSFISGFLEGGEFNALVSMKVLNKAKMTDIKASAKVALTIGAGSIEAEANINMAKSNLQNNTETTITVNWSGGGKLKDENVVWDVDSLTAAAAKFPERVAEVPQRTYAILTKYTALRSFVEQAGHYSPLDYENAGVYTSALLDAYMDYKNIWKGIQMASWEVDNRLAKLLPAPALPQDGVTPYETSLAGLDQARRDCRYQMISIVTEVDEITKNPKLAVDPKRPSPYMSPIVFKQLVPIAKGPNPPAVPLPVAVDAAAIEAPPSKTEPSSTAAAEDTGVVAWVYSGSPRLIYQDSTGDVREATNSPEWKTSSLNLKPKAKTGTPFTICTWSNEARLYYINEENKISEKVMSGGAWQDGTGYVFSAPSIHPKSKLAVFCKPDPLTIHVYYQDTDLKIRFANYSQGWRNDYPIIAGGSAGTGLAACHDGKRVKLIQCWPDGRLSEVLCDEALNYSHNPTLTDSLPLNGTPITGGAWQCIPKANPTAPLDQIRFFFRKDATTIGTYSYNANKAQADPWASFSAPDTKGNIAYTCWHDGSAIKQRLYLQKTSREFVELTNDSEHGLWMMGKVLAL